MRNSLSGTDENIVAAIKRGDERTWIELYKRNHPRIVNHIRSNSGSKEDAEDIIQETMIDLKEKIAQDRFTLTGSINGYIYRECQNKWLKVLRDRKMRPTDRLTGNEQIADDSEWVEDQERELTRRQQLVNLCMQELTERCRRVLHFFYFDNLPMTTIASKEDFANDDSAKSAKAKCISKLRECVTRRMSREQ